LKELTGLLVEKLALHGYGIAHAIGKTIFIPHTAPGDRVDVVLTQERKDIAFASVKRFQKRAPGLQDPGCEVFGGKDACGGCDWLMAPYKLQLEWKDALVHSVFDSFVDPALIRSIKASPQERFYRNKAFFPVSSAKGRLYYGMYQSWTHTVIPHKQCQIQMPVFDKIAQRVIELAQKAGTQAYQEQKHAGNLRQIGMRSSADGSEIVVVIVTKSARLPFTQLLVKHLCHEFPQIVGIVQNIQRERSNVILGKDDRLLWGKPYITEKILGQSFRVHYRSFLQVNPGTSALILQDMKSLVGAKDKVLDAYSGIGTIGLSLADRAAKLSLIEEVPEAVEDATRNAEINKIRNAEFQLGKVEELLRKSLRSSYDTIIFDPPRVGLDEAIPSLVAKAGISRVLYLSCNPMTLSRDLKAFFSRGYRLVELQPYDMFPQTWHIETLAVLQKI